MKSPKLTIQFLIRIAESDQRTILGRTLNFICVGCGLKPDEIHKLTPHMVKTRMSYMKIPENEKWRIPMIDEILNLRNESAVIPGFTVSELEAMLYNLCTS